MMFAAQAVGSAFNIFYNLLHIPPLLAPVQRATFENSITIYNLVAYPPLSLIWARAVFRLRTTPTDSRSLLHLQRSVINLPLIATIVAGTGWLFSIPALFIGLKISGEAVNPHVYFHFPISVCIAALVALTIGYFSIDWARQKLLFPCFFKQTSPSRITGAFRLSIADRGRLWTAAAGICPIVSLFLLLISPSPEGTDLSFVVAVAASGVLCAIISSILMARLIVTPIEELRLAAEKVGKGDLKVEVNSLRADEFGVLADEFNAMILGLQEKERVTTTFGRHVGREIADQLLRNEEELKGVERTVSVLFADIRGFTPLCEKLAPSDAVRLLNLYHEHMTGVIEENGGIVNQLVGDGLMSLFGATGRSPNPAVEAIAAGREMLRSLQQLNTKLAANGFDSLKIGVGINTGPAVVGTIGSPRRMEYTAIGDTVNTASRIESLTKELRCDLLISASTYDLADPKPEATLLPPVEVRGRTSEIVLYSVAI